MTRRPAEYEVMKDLILAFFCFLATNVCAQQIYYSNTKNIYSEHGNQLLYGNTKNMYADNGNQIYYSNTGNIYSEKGQQLFYASTKNIYAENGIQIYYPNGENIYDENGNQVYYANTGHIYHKNKIMLSQQIYLIVHYDGSFIMYYETKGGVIVPLLEMNKNKVKYLPFYPCE